MDDKRIVDLYWERSESAIEESQRKYGKYCYSIAYHILYNEQDSEECVNDTYLRAWQAIPPHRPEKLSAFLGKITRNLALNRHKQSNAQKRGEGKTEQALEELEYCLFDGGEGDVSDEIAVKDALNAFLRSLPEENMVMFMRRYWYFHSVEEIASDLGLGISKVKVTLMRLRDKLKDFLEKEGIVL